MKLVEASMALHNNQYRNEGNSELFKAMKESGILAVFTGSDDIIEYRGAFNDESGMGKIYIDNNGIIESECTNDCPYYQDFLKNKSWVKAVSKENCETHCVYDYTILTSIKKFLPFSILEKEKYYCNGIVFYIKDLK